MELSENKIPITVKRTRLAYIPQYVVSVLLILSFLLVFYSNLGLKISFYITSALGLILLIGLELTVRTNNLEIDKNKITQKWGILSVHSDSIYYEDMTDILIHQSLIGRIFDYGKLHINTGGSEHYEIDFKNLRAPVRIRNFLEVLEKKHVISRTGAKK